MSNAQETVEQVAAVQPVEFDGEILSQIGGGGSDTLQAINRSEVDVQVATAKRYRRSVQAAKKMALTMATLDIPTAASCFYKLKRGGKRIEGASIRLAEIFTCAWGNFRAGARIVGQTDKFVIAQGVAWDLENNSSASSEVWRRITDRDGRRYSDDMVAVTANAACSIASRNAVFRVIPKVYVDEVCEAAKRTAIGNQKTLPERRQSLIEYITQKLGVELSRVLGVVGKEHVEDIDLNDLEDLYGICTAVRDGDITVETAFPQVDGEATDKADSGGQKKASHTQRLASKIRNSAKHKDAPPTSTPQDQHEPQTAGEAQTPAEPPSVPETTDTPSQAETTEQATPDATPAVPEIEIGSWDQFIGLVEEAAQDAGQPPELVGKTIGLLLVSRAWKGKDGKPDWKKIPPAELGEIVRAMRDGRWNWAAGKPASQ